MASPLHNLNGMKRKEALVLLNVWENAEINFSRNERASNARTYYVRIIAAMRLPFGLSVCSQRGFPSL
jgi:hypothetical protein